jgi:hypothetical protein
MAYPRLRLLSLVFAFGFLSSFRLASFVDNLEYHIPNWELMLRQPCLPPVSLQLDRLAFTVDETSCLSPIDMASN